ncbi:MAG: hypothetical protein ACRDRL_28995 [Sciscionella sp.]
MSVPIATSADLGTFLGDPSIDAGRATQVLAIVQGFCEDIITPLPESAFGVVLSAAARIYSNASGVTGETVGPFNVQRPTGVYLTKGEKAALRRAAGIGGAGSTSILPADAASDLPPWDYDTVGLY